MDEEMDPEMAALLAESEQAAAELQALMSGALEQADTELQAEQAEQQEVEEGLNQVIAQMHAEHEAIDAEAGWAS
ncbi:hypothetical protein [Saccharopolyspora shandongensis]|uniref:hypothetical protein n=1 Tax=Saccharopolyspora shandongensis TaxID=418495 RepID=UPI0033C6BAAF